MSGPNGQQGLSILIRKEVKKKSDTASVRKDSFCYERTRNGLHIESREKSNMSLFCTALMKAILITGCQNQQRLSTSVQKGKDILRFCSLIFGLIQFPRRKDMWSIRV